MLDRLQAAATALGNSSFLQHSFASTSIGSSCSKSNRINRISGMTSSSSATSSSSNAANREKRSLQSNLRIAVQGNSVGDESDRSLHSEPPPDPAPPEIPPRTQSLLTSLRKKSDYQLKFEDNGDQKHEQFIPSSQIGKFPPSLNVIATKYIPVLYCKFRIRISNGKSHIKILFLDTNHVYIQNISHILNNLILIY